MASRAAPHSQDSMYVSSSPPSSDPHDPFYQHHPQMPEPVRYYDNDSEHLGRYDRRRDTYASDGSMADDDRYYEHGGGYEYGEQSVRSSLCPFSLSAAHPDQVDTDSDVDVYGQKYIPSTESLGPPRDSVFPESSTPTYMDQGVREPYPAWSSERQIPLSKEEIEDIFLDLTQKFGFQRDSMRNMVCVSFALIQLPSTSACQNLSRASFRFAEPCVLVHGRTWPSLPRCSVLSCSRGTTRGTLPDESFRFDEY